MMPDFPSATGTLSSWRERKGREGRMEEREREERQLERLPTAGNQFPVTESLLGSKKKEWREKEQGDGT